MHQRNATAALYDHNPGQTSEPGDAVTARWLQSAGLQHLASPLSSTGIDHRLLPHLLMQGYGAQSTEEKQKLYRLLRSLNFNSDSGPEPYSLNSHVLVAGPSIDSVYSPEMRGEFGAGLLDLHSMDDTELLSEHVMSEPFEPSSFMPSGSEGTDNDFGAVPSVLQKGSTDSAIRLSNNDKESNSKEGNLAKIKVVVRKRPLNKKEVSRKEDDIVTVCDNTCLTVHEPKLKVDLTAYVEKHEFCFDAVLSEHVSNDEVYRVTVEPIIPTIFERTKATCFAYGQTGSGKTFTMQPLPIKAAEDIVRILHQPTYRNQKYKLWLSYFEIYGGKLFDLLSDRRKLCMREDGRQQVCIVGLQEFEVSHVQIIKEYIEKGNATRSTGSTGANEESSRSHAILQLAIKKHNDIQQSKRQNDGNENKGGKVIGKISFIDLAGSERGADTTDNDRQTRIEGAEINKSLLALKECIRALDNDQIHIPFRGSKLTEVLRDSFVGNSRTVMISCISPNEGSCEHTLNTLRYADRVKSLSKGATSKKDQAPGLTSSVKESSISIPVPLVPDDAYNSNQDAKLMDTTKKFVDKYELEKTSSNFPSNRSFYGREEIVTHANSVQRERFDTKSSSSSSTGQRIYSSVQNSFENVEDEQEKVQKISSHRRHWNEEKTEKQNRITNRDDVSDPFTTQKQQNLRELNSYNLSRAYESDLSCSDGEINAVLEEEEDLISAHRKEIEDTMEIVREEMKLLAEIDQPGSLIDNYVTQLNFLISRKAAGLVSLQNRLSRFQHRLKEQDIYSHKKVLR